MLCVLHSGTRNEVVVEGDTKFLTSSPDGKYLFAEGGIEMLQRMRVDGDVAVLEELSPRIGQNSQEIVVGSDSRLVAMPSGGGNYPVEGHPSVSYGTYIYDVENLRSPKLAISTGPYLRTLAFDPVAKKIYAQNHVRQLIVLNAGERSRTRSSPGTSALRSDFHRAVLDRATVRTPVAERPRVIVVSSKRKKVRACSASS